MKSLGEIIKLPKRVALLIAAVTGMDEVLERIEEEKGEEVDMCESLNIYVRRNREEAFQNGELSKTIQTITNLLKKKLGKLTEETIEKIQQSTIEQLDTLAMSIFDIKNEQDIQRLIE